MIIPKISSEDAEESISSTISINAVGYGVAYIFGASAAVAVGSLSAMICVSAVGSAALYIPNMMLIYLLDYLGFMNKLVIDVIGLSIYAGSAALGALILGLSMEPFIICALIGVSSGLCIVSLILNLSTTTKVCEPPIDSNNTNFSM